MAGAASGAVGGVFAMCLYVMLILLTRFNIAIIGNPLFLIKARMQVIKLIRHPPVIDMSQGILARSSYRNTTPL